jgi:methylthioribose-1-phosphate isomerase
MIPMKPLEWINGRLRFLDQTKLPLEELFCETDDAAAVAEAIKRLAIRGAPLIGIAAALLRAEHFIHPVQQKHAHIFYRSSIFLRPHVRPLLIFSGL